MAELIAITAPADQAEGTEMVVGTWLKKVGESVTQNEPLLEITTDKVTVEIAAPATGTLREILKSADQPIVAGEVLGRIEVGAAAAADPTPSHGPTSSDQPASAAPEQTPAVRRLLAKHALDASAIRGTGRGGRITVQDVEAHVASGAGTTTNAEPGTSPSRKVPHTGMRRSIAQHMVQSVAVAPHVTTVFEADLSAIVADREAHRADFEMDGVKLTYTAYFIRASVAALQAVPEVNSRWHDDALELFGDCNIGVATALPQGGLILPVIHCAQTLDLRATAKRLQDLTQRARAGALDPKDVQHGTFSISNHGVSGSLVAAPIIIPQPQSAILGVGKVERRPVARMREGVEVVEVRPMCYVTLTIDHRVLDGYQANAFLARWVEEIEGWS
ncbi:MAG TPA: 2-oxo acid dehydrogenase subunit E2 [Gemmatimonadales bacterium]|jgi:2-oxoglutarate dehydrogenase E2 component (dihydrolipoamide succinyltransferase)|nr:2-oxo acid dehydrogenase subunit E2 [Gemmatimonadales bacterium]